MLGDYHDWTREELALVLAKYLDVRGTTKSIRERAAAELGWRGVKPPVQYLAGFSQLARNLEKQQQAGPV